MASIIANCLAKLVRQRKITQRQADAALALHEGQGRRLDESISHTRSDAAAALEAAEAMADAARRRRRTVATDAIRLRDMDDRMKAHPNGQLNGLGAALSLDVSGAKTPGVSKLNVEGHSEVILGDLLHAANKFVEPFRSRMAGLRQDLSSFRNAIREIFDGDTGDPIAKAAAAAWRGAIERAVARAQAGGRNFSILEDWRLPQFWERTRVKQFRNDFVQDILNAVDAGRMTIMDKVTGLPANRLQADGIVRVAMKDILEGTNRGSAGRGFSRDMRIFKFNDPEAYLEFMGKYGPGTEGNIYSMMLGHLATMSREIGLIEILGPTHRSNFNRLLAQATAAAPEKKGSRLARGIYRPRLVELTYMDTAGLLSVPQGEKLAGIFGALRSLKTATSLGSATISALPGDTVTTIWTANQNGIPATKVLSRAINLIAADSATSRELAGQMQLVAHQILNTTVTARRFEDTVVGTNLSGRLAQTVIRASGLQAWTEGLKRAFSMEFHGLIARQADFAWDGLDRSFRRFLERYGFTPDDWATLRKTAPIEVEGTRFFDPAAAGDLGSRMANAINDERHFAVIEPTSLARAITTVGTQRGTWAGEIARSAFLFKSFAMTVMLTHLTRAMVDRPWWQAIPRGAGFVVTMMLGGAAALQAKQIIAGRDPRDMTDPKFLWAALSQGGGAGIYGDLLYSATTRAGQGLMSTLWGPVIGEIGGLADLMSSGMGAFEGREGRERFARTLVQTIKRWTPGSTLWYARVAVDREIFDLVQSMVAPNVSRDVFNRQIETARREFGQDFWFRPGTRTPQRAPDLGAALGR